MELDGNTILSSRLTPGPQSQDPTVMLSSGIPTRRANTPDTSPSLIGTSRIMPHTCGTRKWNSLEVVTGEDLVISGLILGLVPANERRRYKVTLTLFGWVQT